MKNSRGNKRPGPPPLGIKRHYVTLTPKETQDAVESVAELIVNFVKKKGLVSSGAPAPASADTETQKGTSEKKEGGAEK